jgi:tetratricopeptide (TPR) repeat protein
MRAAWILLLALIAAPAAADTSPASLPAGGGAVADLTPAPLHGVPGNFLADLERDREIKAAVADQLKRNPPLLLLAQRAQVEVAYLTRKIADSPDDAALYDRRCFMRGLTKRDLDAALGDCERAISLKPGTVAFLDRRGLILYMAGQYKEAVAAFDAALARDPNYAASLLLRGYAKGALGDEAGKAADIAAARAANPGVVVQFVRLGVIAPPG